MSNNLGGAPSFPYKQIQITIIENLSNNCKSTFNQLYPDAKSGSINYPDCSISFEKFTKLNPADISDNHYFEIGYSDWASIDDKSVFKDYNVMVSNVREAFIYTSAINVYPNISKYWFNSQGEIDDIDVESPCNAEPYAGLEIPKRVIVVTDNIMPKGHPIKTVKFISSKAWLCEHPVQTVLSNQFDEQTIRNNIFLPKRWKFIALMGAPKQHRWDFFNKVTSSPLVDDCLIGSYHPHFRRQVRYDSHIYPCEGEYNDFTNDHRNMEKEWIEQCNFWVSMETWYKGDFDPISQLTEKTYKSMAVGMPFVISGGGSELDALTELGFENFIDVFGDYRGNTFQETNDNIIKIISDPSRYDRQTLTAHCIHNNQRLRHWTATAVWEDYLENVNNTHMETI